MPPINVEEVLSGIELTEDQRSALEDIQNNLNTRLEAEINVQKKGLLKKNEELIGELRQAKENKLPDGFDLKDYQEYVKNKDKIEAERIKAEEERLIATQNWDKLKHDMLTEHERTLQDLQSKYEKDTSFLRRTLDSELIENSVIKAIDREKGNQTLLMPHIKSSMRTVQDEETGRFLTQVVDASGEPRMDPKTGEPMKIEDLVAELKSKPEFAPAFPLQNQGSQTIVNVDGKNYNSTNNPFDKKSPHYSITKQAQLNRTNPTLASKLKEQAKNS